MPLRFGLSISKGSKQTPFVGQTLPKHYYNKTIKKKKKH